MSKLKLQDLLFSNKAMKLAPLELQASGRLNSEEDSDDNLQQFAI